MERFLEARFGVIGAINGFLARVVDAVGRAIVDAIIRAARQCDHLHRADRVQPREVAAFGRDHLGARPDLHAFHDRA